MGEGADLEHMVAGLDLLTDRHVGVNGGAGEWAAHGQRGCAGTVACPDENGAPNRMGPSCSLRMHGPEALPISTRSSCAVSHRLPS